MMSRKGGYWYHGDRGPDCRDGCQGHWHEGQECGIHGGDPPATTHPNEEGGNLPEAKTGSWGNGCHGGLGLQPYFFYWFSDVDFGNRGCGDSMNHIPQAPAGEVWCNKMGGQENYGMAMVYEQFNLLLF